MAAQGGQVIIITGVSSGLGCEMVRWFRSKGHTVLGCARSSQAVKQLNEEFCPEKEPAQFSVVDITDETDVKRWVEDSISQFGPPTFLLNNAGITNNNANLWQITAEEFNKVIDINIKGTTNVIRHFVPEMIKAGRGVIVNFTSTWGRSVSPHVAPYCATKWALEGLSKALALELPAPLVCVPLNPGVINTPMLNTIFGERGAAMNMSPEEWVKTACPFILSIDSHHNGKSLTVP